MKFSIIVLLISLCVGVSQISAQPVISRLNLRGLQIGSSTELTISGQGLNKGTKVVLPFAMKQETIAENGSSSLQVKLSLSDDVQPGLYPLRLFNETGLSEPVLIGVDRLPHRIFDAAKQSLPVALSGDLAGARILKTSFSAQKDELVVLEVEANRLGGKLRPVIHLYDSRGRQVAFAQPSRFLGGDARCFLRIPKNGDYFVEFHDFLFRGASPGFFRLKLGKFEYADLTLPVAVESTQKQPLRLIKIDAESEFLEELELQPLGWSRATTSNRFFSGQVPQVLVSEINEFVESGQSKEPVTVGKVPVGINGRISAMREVDRFLIDVEPNSKLTFDLMGQRLGSPLDAKIRITNKAGNTLAENDDGRSDQDARINYTVPGNVQQLIVEVSDVAARGSKSHVYRLSVRKLNRPQVAATVDRQTFQAPKDGTIHLPIKLARVNYNGPVELVVSGLPAGVELSGTSIPAGSDLGLLTLSSIPLDPVYFSVKAKIMVGDKPLYFDVLGPETANIKGFNLRRQQFAVAAAAARQLDLTWDQSDMGIKSSLGGAINSKVSIKRAGQVKGPVRIRLIADQKVPKKRIRKNNKDIFVDDVENTIRAKTVELAGDQSEAEFVLEIPNAIPEKQWQIVLVAEWLSADKKKVLLTSSTRTIKLTTRRLATVQLKKGKLINVPRQGVARLQVSGTVQGNESKLPCRIRLSGLPKGVEVKPVTVAGDKADFDVTLEVPVNAELLKAKSLNLDFEFLAAGEPARIEGKAKRQKVKVKVEPAAPKNAQPNSDSKKKK